MSEGCRGKVSEMDEEIVEEHGGPRKTCLR